MRKKNQSPAISAICNAMEKLGLTQEELAGILGRAQPTVSELLRGNRNISPEIAIDLEAALHGEVDAAHLLEAQSAFQLQEARKVNTGDHIRLKARIRSEFPILEMEKRGWIQKFEDVNQKAQAVLDFANGSPDFDRILPPFKCEALARQSPTLGYLAPSSPAGRAWQYRVKALAEMTPVKEFDHENFVSRGLPELRSLVRNAKNIAQVPQILAKHGVRFVIVERLTTTKLDGIATWLDDEAQHYPVIALTLRLGNIGNFWFSLAHELQHIALKHAYSLDSDPKEESEHQESLKQVEKEADQAAAEWLIPQARLEAFIKRNGSRFLADHIQAFSQMTDVHPGVLVGMLHHKGVMAYSRFSEMKIDIRKNALLAAMADGFGLPTVRKSPQK